MLKIAVIFLLLVSFINFNCNSPLPLCQCVILLMSFGVLCHCRLVLIIMWFLCLVSVCHLLMSLCPLSLSSCVDNYVVLYVLC